MYTELGTSALADAADVLIPKHDSMLHTLTCIITERPSQIPK